MTTKEISNLYKSKKEENKALSAQPIVYRAGQKPQWVEEDSDEDIFGKDEVEEVQIGTKEKEEKKVNKNQVIEPRNIDRRLLRLAQMSQKDEVNRQTIRPKREIYKSHIVVDPSLKEENKNKVESKVSISREDIKRKLLEEESKKEKLTDKEDTENELMELIGESDDDNNHSRPEDGNGGINDLSEDLEEDEANYSDNEEILMRPIFVSKEERKTMTEEQMRELEEKELREQQEIIKELRKKQTKEIVKKYLEENEEKEEINEEAEDTGLPDDTDHPDDLEEYEKWKLRELRRIKIQFEEDEKKLKERLEIERRRNLTDEQRKEENLRLGSNDTLRPFKSKIGFLQKYYHKGAFFQQNAQETLDHIYNRDYNLPTWEDKVDRSALPKILQKRRGMQFKKGQTKYTHLTAEDTTNFDINYKVPDFIANKLQNNLAGWKSQNEFELTKKKRK